MFVTLSESLVAGLGFEPRFAGSEPTELPLLYPAILKVYSQKKHIDDFPKGIYNSGIESLR